MTEIEHYLPPGTAGACWLRSDRRLYDKAPRRLYELNALHVLKGQMRYMLDGKIVTAGPQTLIWAFSDQSHFLVSETRDLEMWVLVFSRDTLNERCPPAETAELERTSHNYSLGGRAHRELNEIATSLRNQTDQALLRPGLQWWAIRAWASSRESPLASARDAHRAVLHAAEILDEAPQISLRDVAALSGLSQSRLGHLFKIQMGLTLNTYRIQRRLLVVDRLLAKSPRISLMTAAIDAGFGSYAQFYRCFVVEHGCSPRDYYA